MNTYEVMLRRLQKAACDGKLQTEINEIRSNGTSEELITLNKLENPKEQPPVIYLSDFIDTGKADAAHQIDCLFGAIERDENGSVIITNDCSGCGTCINECKSGEFTARKDLIPVLQMLNDKKYPVYAMIAPAFSGQFSEAVTSGKLRSAFKKLGFYGMIEVALFADILTLKEALEFDRFIKEEKDFILTSCCCPMWVALIKKNYSSLIPHIPPSVSPMVACGRAIKKIHPDAKTVFIGPCLAKKAEAKNEDIADAVDYVFTFDEIAEMFKMMQIDPTELPEDSKDHSSSCGRIYARTGGVSEAVKNTLEKLRPGRTIPLRAVQADGIVACKQLLKDFSEGKVDANFIEGMGCKGGCVGGPKILIDAESGTKHVSKYAEAAISKTPADNPYVLSILEKLGYTTIENLLDEDNNFIRRF